MKVKLSLLFFYVLFFQDILSQQAVDNDKAHRRYWYYRARMINDFMKIGKEQGSCIVFAERNNGEDNSPPANNESKIGPDQIDITNMYIMALCLEYKLLTRNNQDTRETIKELYHMLYTLNRLDLEAEPMMSSSNWHNGDIIQPTGILNGYMLREDMPKQFMRDNFLYYNYGLQEPSTLISGSKYVGFTGIQRTDSLSNDNKFSDFFLGREPFADLPLVQDKYMSMLTAMMFVNKYIPYTTTYNGESFQDGESSIKQEASNIANRCYSYLKSENNGWTLKYLDQNGNYGGPLTIGSSAYLYSWPLSRMACWANTNFPWNQNNPVQCTSYNDGFATNQGRIIYNGFTQGTISCAQDNAVFKGWCQSGSNSPSFNALGVLAPIYVGMGPNTAYNGIEWFELLRKVLHQDGALLRQLSIYGDAINVAPCQGPYNYGNCSNGGFEWSSQDRLEHPSSRGSDCNPNVPNHPVPCLTYVKTGGFWANYPGVDYMLLHNLYYEYQNQLMDGNMGNAVNDPYANAVTTIYNAATTVGSAVGSAWCSIQNAFGGIFQGNSSICDPTIQSSGNGALGSNNVNVGRYYAYNYMDNHDANIWPRNVIPGAPAQGTDNFIAKVAVFQYLTTSAHIYASASPAAPQNTIPSNVIYRAGKEIHIKPGFTIELGSNLRVWIQRYVCNDNADPLQMRQANDSLAKAQLLKMDYESDPINPVPIHYVESPPSDADNNPVVSESAYENEYIDLLNINEFEVVPNPSSGIFKISTQKLSEEEVLSADVYDMKGQLIYSVDHIASEQEISLDKYSNGIYMIQVTSNMGRSMVKKINISR
jgi:hypothetical protein